MRCHPTRWLWGLIPIAMLGWIAVHVEGARIEHDLEQRADHALTSAGYDWASVIFSGRDGMLAGTPGSGHERAQALALVSGLWGVRTVVAKKRFLDRLDPVGLADRRVQETLSDASGPSVEARPLAEAAPVSLGVAEPDALADLRPERVVAYEPEARPAALLDAQKTQAALPVATMNTAAIPDAGALAGCRVAVRRLSGAGRIHFAIGEADLDTRARAQLDRLADVAADCPTLALRVAGHADAEGPEERNLSLSEQRARIVVSYLIRKGIDAGRLEAVGYGETRPVAPNDTTLNRARNRRIEIEVAGPLR